MKFTENSSTPLYRQFAEYVKDRIRRGKFIPEKALPSINAMKISTGISRETIVKGYAWLCQEGVLVPQHGMGYFIKPSFLSGRSSVIIFLDKMSQHQQNILDGFIETVGEKVDITIRMHYQNPRWLEEEVNKAAGVFDWYLIFPHFAQDEETRKTVEAIIRKLPAEKLIILDHLPETAPAASGASFQSIENDVPGALEKVIDDIRKYEKLRYLPLSFSLCGDLVANVLKKFSDSKGINVEILKDIPEEVKKGELFFVSGSRLDKNLSKLLKAITGSGWRVGEEIGLICYNDFPLNEYILGGLTTLTTDFVEMGRVAGEMILSGKLSKEHISCSLIRRNTF